MYIGARAPQCFKYQIKSTNFLNNNLLLQILSANYTMKFNSDLISVHHKVPYSECYVSNVPLLKNMLDDHGS